MEQINLRVSRDAVEEFKESILWADIVEELNSWKTGFELERGSIVDDAAENNPSTASILLHLGDISGRIKAVDYMLSIPDVFLGLLDTKKEE
jgi:hypothetical protein